MDINVLARFFMWCTLLNLGLLIVSTLFLLFAADFVYGLHRRWFSMKRETFNALIYSFIGAYKLLILVFCLVPWAALVIIR